MQLKACSVVLSAHLGVKYLLELVLEAGPAAGFPIPGDGPVPAADLGLVDALLHQRSRLLLRGTCSHSESVDSK